MEKLYLDIDFAYPEKCAFPVYHLFLGYTRPTLPQLTLSA